jgi:hypothetical protein
MGIEPPAPDGRRPGQAVSGAALSPAGALAWLHSLSIDLRAAAVLGPGGDCLAGDAALARRAAAVLDATASGASGAGSGGAEPARSGIVAEIRAGDLLAVRSDRHAVAVALGPCALERLARADMRDALAALDGR